MKTCVSQKMVLASPYLRAFWSGYTLNSSSTNFNVIFTQNLEGKVDAKKFRQSIQNFISDIYIFNCHLEEVNDSLYWVINENSPVVIIMEDRFVPHDEIKEFSMRPFNIKKGPLLRFGLFAISPSEYKLVIVFHHILVDGNSIAGIFSEIEKYYNIEGYRYCLTREAQIQKIKDLYLSSKAKIQQLNQPEDFWKGFLKNKNGPVELRHFSDNPKSAEIKEQYFCIEKLLLEKIRKFKHTAEVSSFTILMSAWYILLCRYLNENEINIHFPISLDKDSEFFLGANINPVPLSEKIDDNQSFYELCSKLKRKIEILKSTKYWHYPINEILKVTDHGFLNFSIAKTTLKKEKLKLSGVYAQPRNEICADIGRSDLLLLIENYVEKNKLSLCIKYREKVLSKHYASQIQDDFLDIVNKLIDHPEKPLKKIQLNSALASFNAINKLYQPGKVENSFRSLIINNLKIYRDQLAVIFDCKAISYQELDVLSNQFAHFVLGNIKTRGKGRSKTVALMLNRSLDMIIAIVGLIKLGLTYLPLESTIPEFRLKNIIEDAAPILFLRHQSAEEKIKYIESVAFSLEDLYQYSQECPDHIFNSKYIYQMYTSGSTGKPKGIRVNDSCAVNRILNMVEISGLSVGDKYLFKTSYGFDVSFSDIFVALFSGATLHVSKNVFDLAEISRLIESKSIDAVHFVPSQFRILSEVMKIFDSLKLINFSGESLLPSDLTDINLNITKVVNYYGPTETGECIFHHVTSKSYIPIGLPLSGYSAVIFGKGLSLVPMGAIGELYLHGLNTEECYIHSKDSCEKIISNPISDISHAKAWYKTGDLVRVSRDGKLEYIGRLDSQVKCNGYRVDLEEVKSVIMSFEFVRSAAISLGCSGRIQYIDAYLDAEENFNLDKLRHYLIDRLPYYSIPSNFYFVISSSVNINGKLEADRYFLAKASVEKLNHSPKTELEFRVRSIFSDVFNTSNINMYDNFFDLGGNSLLLTELISKIESQFKISLSIEDFYKYPRVIDICSIIKNNSDSFFVTLKESCSNERIIFFHTTQGGCEVYQQLAEYLDIESVGVKSFNLHSEILKDDIEDLCQTYAENIIHSTLIDEKRLILCGWSFGGLLAFKVAALLSQHLEYNPSVILLDALTPEFYKRILFDIPKSYQFNMLENSATDYSVDNAFLNKLRLISSGYQKMIPESRLFLYGGFVLLIKASRPTGLLTGYPSAQQLYIESDHYFWDKYCSKKLCIEVLNAEHESMLSRDNLKEIAALFTDFIKYIQKDIAVSC